MLQAYMDASGTHAGSRIVVIAGFVGEESDWITFDQRWRAVLDDPQWPSPLTEFHMVDCAHGDGEFFNGHWNYAQRLSLYGDLCRVISQATIRPIGASVVSECFQQLPASDLALLQDERNRLGTPLDICFQMLMQQLLGIVNESTASETVGVIFDKDSRDKERKFSDFCEHYGRDYHLADAFVGYGFVDSKTFTALQAADLLAYGTLHLATRAYYPTEAEPDFPILRAFWKMLVGLAGRHETSPYGTLCNLQSLQELVVKIKTGKMLPKKQRST